MSYLTISHIKTDTQFLLRCSASVASEVSAGSSDGDTAFTEEWTNLRSWDLAATPGWAAKWESALAGGISNPGENSAVITDGDILSRIQQLLATYPLTASPVP